MGLLIGTNCVKALEPLEAVSSQDGGPCAVRTSLGWCFVGPLDNVVSNVNCNFVGNLQRYVPDRSPLSHVYDKVSDHSITKFL